MSLLQGRIIKTHAAGTVETDDTTLVPELVNIVLFLSG